MNNKFTPEALRLEGQPMFRLLERVQKLEAKGHTIVHFEIGDPDFNTPNAVVERCIRSLRAGQTHYTSSYGLTELREVIIRHTYQELGFKPSLEQVLIAPGANPLMSYGVKVASPGVHDSCRERTIIINSFSKSFAMTGWRLGYMIGPEFLIERISLLIQTIISCVPSFIQWAGLSYIASTLWPHIRD